MLLVLCIMLTDSITLTDVYVEPNPTGGVCVLFKDGTRRDLKEDQYTSVTPSDDRQEIKEEHRSALKESTKPLSAKAPEPIVIKSKGNQKRDPVSKEQIANNLETQRLNAILREEAKNPRVGEWDPTPIANELRRQRREKQTEELKQSLEILKELQDSTEKFDKLKAEGALDF